MKKEKIKTTVVCLLLGIMGAVFLTGSAFAAEDEGQIITVPVRPLHFLKPLSPFVSSGINVGGPDGINITPDIIRVGGPNGININPDIISVGGPTGINISPDIINVGGPNGIIIAIPGPNLVPIVPFPPPPPDALDTLPQNFCKKPDDGLPPSDAIRVIIRNVGTFSAGESITMVEFFKGFSDDIVATPMQATPALGPGEQTTLDFDIPQGCYVGESGCEFKITVDAMDDVVEANEANSVESGCPGVVS